MASWDSLDLDLIEINAKAIYIILSALGERQENQVHNCGNAKKICDKLDELYGQPLEKKLEKDDLLDESHQVMMKRISNFELQEQTMR
ncbi:Uncharacterized protein TCM_013516 [Theobroma cacao]|uniref:Uncharacterized protein n=1 Tax=Theobroma cacao TaxID=3641 RepID=A0A061G3L1_THECC|nr:Uncharacterized protein TCM_013516 [Theobroma cacao]